MKKMKKMKMKKVKKMNKIPALWVSPANTSASISMFVTPWAWTGSSCLWSPGQGLIQGALHLLRNPMQVGHLIFLSILTHCPVQTALDIYKGSEKSIWEISLRNWSGWHIDNLTANLTLIEVIGRDGLPQNCCKAVLLFAHFHILAHFHKLLGKIKVQLCFSGNHIAKNYLEKINSKVNEENNTVSR